MRVLSISTLFPAPPRPAFGGFVGNQMQAVAARGDVDLVMLNPLGVPPWPLSTRSPYRELAGCPAHSQLGAVAVRHPRFLALPGPGADTNPGRITRQLLPLARELHGQKPFDLVDAQFFFPDGPAAARIAADLGLPLTIKARGSDIHYWSTHWWARRQLVQAAAQARTILTVSAALGRDMAALGFPAERIVPHYTGLDRARFRPLPQTEARSRLPGLLGLDVPEGVPLLLTPGSLIARKGQMYALRALRGIPAAHLVLAGKGPDEAALRTEASRLGLTERLHFLGQVSHVALPVLMAAADLTVLPSSGEGLANVWVESLACGTRLVIPDIGGAREVVRSTVAGRLVGRDPAGIAQAVNDLLASPIAPEQVAAEVAGFSWQANAEALVRIWQKACAH